VALDVLVKEVVEANLPLAEKKSQIIGVFTSAPLVVEGDYDRLREAVDNVLSNAIKFSPVGGRIEIAMELNEGQAQIHIRYSGPGLRGEDHSRLFERFQRFSARPTFGESSTGLGLSIAKRIVDLHGGRIFAHSAAPHRGATFTISLEAAGLTE
jgi:signal transduction histidine kinase